MGKLRICSNIFDTSETSSQARVFQDYFYSFQNNYFLQYDTDNLIQQNANLMTTDMVLHLFI